MSLVKYEPQSLDFFNRFRREMDDWMSNWFTRDPLASHRQGLLTPVDLSELDNEFVVKVDVPGMREEDIKVTCQGDHLTIQGERKHEHVEEKGSVRYAERQYGTFMRALTIPGTIKADGVRARYVDGVLEVHLPKAEKTQTRAIKVERGK